MASEISSVQPRSTDAWLPKSESSYQTSAVRKVEDIGISDLSHPRTLKTRTVENLTPVKKDLLLKIGFVLLTAAIAVLFWKVIVGFLVLKILFSAVVGLIDLIFYKKQIKPAWDQLRNQQTQNKIDAQPSKSSF